MFDIDFRGANYPMNFTKGLAYTLLGISCQIAPYDTGNLVWAINLKYATPWNITTNYPKKQVHYINIVEEWEKSPNQWFIRKDTRDAYDLAIRAYFTSGAGRFRTYNRRKFLSGMARQRGHGANRYNVGHSRHNRDTRADRFRKSRDLYYIGKK